LLAIGRKPSLYRLDDEQLDRARPIIPVGWTSDLPPESPVSGRIIA
jgi:hypothetical protein